MVWFYFQTFNPELPALDMSLMETPPGMENVRVRFTSVMGKANVVLGVESCLMYLKGGNEVGGIG